jgi:hypothetical protein
MRSLTRECEPLPRSCPLISRIALSTQVIGVKGAFADAWTYDAYAQVGITQLQDIQGNYLGTPGRRSSVKGDQRRTACVGGLH